MFPWVFGFLGLIIFGPVGAIIGAIIGFLISNGSQTRSNTGTYSREPNYGGYDPNFIPGSSLPYRVEVMIESLVALGMLVARADKRLFPKERDVIKSFIMSAQFGPDAAINAFVEQAIERYKTEYIDLHFHIRRLTPFLSSQHLQVVVLLMVDVAHADGHFDKDEIDVIRQICRGFGVSETILDQFMSRKGLTDSEARSVLGVSAEASQDEIKKAYRKLALQYHPDRIPSTATEAEKKTANGKFIEIQKAYDYLMEKGK